ncbi:asparagine synthase (glutamine-hydrolyzing) [Salinifilum aidingensis]
MCGICGWIDFHRDLRGDTPTLESMSDTMACRGPDAAGTWVSQHAALMHRRLAIIDLPGGTQPMTCDPTDNSAAGAPVGTPGRSGDAVRDGEVALVYSGETYNFTELREDLRSRGHRFSTDSDTEVVLRAYLEWGTELAERLNGMFAFAIWDNRTEQLVLVRDRLGIKPLYYYPTERGVLFGSEPKAILANPAAEKTVEADGLRELLLHTKTPGHGIWSGMREVQPGTVVAVDRTGVRETTYWRLEPAEHTDDQSTSTAHVRELLDDIVRRQLVSDVPRCVLLSGGLDSSALTALSAEQLRGTGEALRTFAVDFVGQTENFVPDLMRDTPDGPYVHDVAEHVQSEHRDIVLDPGALADPAVRRAAVRSRDIPAGLGDMDQSLYLLFKAIREHSTVALSGESADEVFGGYRWFHDPRVQRAETFPWMAAASAHVDEHLRALNPHVRRAVDAETFLADSYRSAVAEVPTVPGESDFERRMRVICYLHLTRFVRMLLDRKDRLSMAVGLEVRVPFCDHRLVEYAFNAPWSLKTHDGREKSLLRGATADVLPESVANRVKSPYPSTQDAKYAAALQHQVHDLLGGQEPAFDLFDPGQVRQAAETEPAELSAGGRNLLEHVLDFSTWFELHAPTVKV